MGGVEDAAQAIAAKPGPAAVRLRELIITIHRMNSERYVGDSKLHEMVEIAMEESWEVCVAHMQRLTETIAQVIAEGAASGEFDAPDVALAAMCTCTAMMRFFHPQMIAQAASKPGPSLDQMVDFVLAGLTSRGRRGNGGQELSVIPGAMRSIEPGIAIVRVWCCRTIPE